ncbi:uncharacterized protein KIAA1211 homolog [Lingula anatina]|uniref:Uncharacterized protein KIAA1211 homolog n=1 Tax=Lingula anatina TaxID=7574 RepID=A0A1S3JTQ1_LINAN|nr:uncharacterized protein KIAA1211 homolog [Lingula anatina]|eukprot:XP_013413444.1 uncharacterized protein KIAA1211 homolog [Lingula anatina]
MATGLKDEKVNGQNSDESSLGLRTEERAKSRAGHLALWIDAESGHSGSSSRPITPLDCAAVPLHLSRRLPTTATDRDPAVYSILLEERLRTAEKLRREQLKAKTPSTGARLEKATQKKLEEDIIDQERKRQIVEAKLEKMRRRPEEIRKKKEQMELEKKKAREAMEKAIKAVDMDKVQDESKLQEERLRFEEECLRNCENNQKKYPIQRDVFEETKAPSRFRRWWNSVVDAIRSLSCFGGRRRNRVHPMK